MDVNAIVNQYEQTWATRDGRAMVACFTDGGTYNAPGADHLDGAAIGEFADTFFSAFPDCTYVWTVAVTGADVAAVEWVFSGTMTQDLMGIPPTGGIASVRGMHIVRCAGDKVASVEALWDNQGFFEQLGIKI